MYVTTYTQKLPAEKPSSMIVPHLHESQSTALMRAGLITLNQAVTEWYCPVTGVSITEQA